MSRTDLSLAMVLALGVVAVANAAEAVAAPPVPAAPQDEEVTLATCPVPVQAALTRASANGAIKKVRKVSDGGAVAYVARIEVVVDSEGKPLPPRQTLTDASPAAAAPDPAAAVLAKPVTVTAAGVKLEEVCTLLSTAAGVPVTCGRAFAGRLVTVSFKDTPFGEALKVVAEQTGTRAEAREGGYRFRTGTAIGIR